MLNMSVQITNTEDIQELPEQFEKGLKRGMRKAMVFAEQEAKNSFGQAGHLNSRSGRLKNSIESSVRKTGIGYIGSLNSDVVYAAVHEYGAVIHAKNDKYMKFPIDGRWVTVEKVVIPPRPFMEPAISENVEEINEIIVREIIRETNNE